MSARRTYWHLESQARKPSEYDIGTSRLLYYPERGFEVRTPGGAWMAEHRQLEVPDWERFRDPRETTYSRYVERQQAREIYVDGLFASIDGSGYDARLGAAWVETLGAYFCPLRYPLSALQMVASYVGHLAPSGRIVVACAMQTGDEIRRIQRIAYRMRQLQETHPRLGDDSRARWEKEAAWQPLRRVLEELLVTWGWGEAFAALCLVVKPLVDGASTTALARAAERAGDDALARILGSLDEDCRWHREWSDALTRVIVEASSANRDALAGWVARWRAEAVPAIQALEAFCPGVAQDVVRAVDDRLHGLGVA